MVKQTLKRLKKDRASKLKERKFRRSGRPMKKGKKPTKPNYKLNFGDIAKEEQEAQRKYWDKKNAMQIDNKEASKEGRVRKRQREIEEGEEEPPTKRQRKLLREKKLARKKRKVCGELVVELNEKIWKKAVNDMNRKEKAEFVTVIIEKVMSVKESIRALATKPDGSRDLQVIAINGTRDQRTQLANETAKYASHICRDKFGAHLIQKILDHGTDEIHQNMRQALWKDIFILSKNKQTVKVVDTIFRNCKTIEKGRMLQMFYSREFVTMPALKNDGNPKNLAEILEDPIRIKKMMMKNLWGNLQKMLLKGFATFHFTQAVLLEYLKNCDREEVAAVVDQVVEHQTVRHLLQSEAGVDAMIRILDGSLAKQRKKIISEVREHVVEMSKDKYTHMFVIRLFDVVDDTQRLQKQLLAPLLAKEACLDLLKNSYGKFVFLHILSPRNKSIFHRKHLAKLPEPLSMAYLNEQKKQGKLNGVKETSGQDAGKMDADMSGSAAVPKKASDQKGETGKMEVETAVAGADKEADGEGKTEPACEKSNDTKNDDKPKIWAVCKKSPQKRRDELLRGLLLGVDEKKGRGLLEVLTKNCVPLLNNYHFIVMQWVLKVCMEEKAEYKERCEALVEVLVNNLTNEDIVDHNKGHRALKILAKQIPEIALRFAHSLEISQIIDLIGYRGVWILTAMLDDNDAREVITQKLEAPMVLSALRRNSDSKGVVCVMKLLDMTY